MGNRKGHIRKVKVKGAITCIKIRPTKVKKAKG